jgi:signal transduction histidine kinase
VANGLPSARVTPSFEDSRGDLWMTAYVGSDYRVVRWQRSTGRFHQHPEADSQLVSLRGPAFAEDGAGTVWLGSSRGLARYRDGRFTNVGMGDGNRIVPVTALHADPRGRLWVGTRGAGLYRSDDPAAERPRFTAYAVADGLSSATVWCLTSDHSGNLYAGTTRGVDRLEPESGRFKRFSVADGLAGSEVITAFRDRDGALWFGSFTGISRLTAQPHVDHAPPAVWIGGLRIRGVAQPLDLLGQPHVSMGRLAPHQSQVQIDYFGLSPASAELLTYQHQLEGAHSAWSAPTPDRTVNYAELAPGSYRFLVRAVDADGQASRLPASVTFAILPPLWKRGWFIGSLALLATASGYSVHRYRVKRLFEMERLRTRIASDLHDDVGSSLTQISILSEIVRTRLANPGAPIDDPLSRIGTLSRESVDSMSDIVWAIDPVRDTPVHLVQRMRRVAYELLGSAGVQLRFESSGDASPRLTADVRRHVFLMFKEILNNVVRHADATAVCIEVSVAARQLHVVVSDDGRGFDTRRTTEGQGLRSLERRTSSLGGSLQVTSSPGAGTRVALSVPAH